MRDSFVLSGDCSYSFEINPDDFPFPPLALCTIPDFTTATMVLHIPEILPPDISPPELCHCFTFNVTHSITLGSSPPAADCIGDSDSQQPKIDFNIQRLTQDCCDMAFSVNLDLDIPCMPFDIQADFLDLRVGGKAQPSGISFIAAKRDSTCAWDVDLSISIPCMPFDLRTTSTIEIGDKLSMLFDITRGSSVEQTQLVELFTLMEFTGISYHSTLMPNVTHTLVPEVTFTLGTYFFEHPSCGWTSTVQEIPVTRMVSVPTIVMLPELIATKFVCEETRPAGYTHTVETGPPCEFEFNLDLELPCLPLAMNLTREIVEKAEITIPEMRFSAKRASGDPLATCDWNFELSIAIPDSITCAEISLDASSDIVLKSDITAPTIRFDVTKLDDCEWDFELSIAIPAPTCPDISLDASGAIVLKPDINEPTIRFDVTKLDDCEWNFEISIAIPEGEFSCGELDFSKEATIVLKDDIDAPELRFEIIAEPGTCDYRFEISIAIPEGEFSCGELDFSHQETIVLKDDIETPEIRVDIIPEPGTCDYRFEISIAIPESNFSCGELDFSHQETIVIKDDIDAPEIRVDIIEEAGTCDYRFEISIAIPEGDFSCGELTFKVMDKTIVEKNIPVPTMRFDVSKSLSCEWHFDLSIAIPERFSCGDIAIEAGLANQTIVEKQIPQPEILAEFVKSLDPCDFQFHISIAIPERFSCGDIDITALSPNQQIVEKDIASPDMVVRWVDADPPPAGGTCEFQLEISIAIPNRFSCGDIDITAYSPKQIIVEKNIAVPDMVVRWVDGPVPGGEAECEFQLEVSIAIPNRFSCGDINIEANAANQHISEGAIPQPFISAAFIKSLDPCDFQFHISIAIPNRFSCGDMDMTILEPNQTIVQKDNIDTPTMRFEVKDADPPPAGGTCEHQFELSIAIPESITCGDISLTAVVTEQDITFVPSLTDPTINVSVLEVAVGDIGGGEECEWKFQVSIGLPSYPDISDLISCGDISFNVAKSTIVQDAALAAPTMLFAVARDSLNTCKWNFDLSIAIPSGGGGGISCGELSGGVLIDVGNDCTIHHDCVGLRDADVAVYNWYGPDLINYTPANKVLSFHVEYCDIELTCGHIEGWACAQVGRAITFDFITCGDLKHGAVPTYSPGTDWITIGADCTIMHRVDILYDNAGPAIEFIGIYGGDNANALDVTVDAGGDVGIAFKHQDLLFNVAEGHIIDIQGATPVEFFNTFPGKTDTITLIGPGSSVKILEFKNGLLWTVS